MSHTGTFHLMTFDARAFHQRTSKTPTHFQKQRQKFAETYYEETQSKFGKREAFGKREGLDDLKKSLRTPY